MNMNKREAPILHGGGVTESIFDLQRFAQVDNPYEFDIDANKVTDISIIHQSISLRYYAQHNIPNYQTATTIPQENIEYLSSGLYANRCDSMFEMCKQLTSIPWNDFNIDTSQCKYMDAMFNNCRALTNLDLSSMNTNNVMYMNEMFYRCESLTSLDISNFDTGKVTNMIDMFNYCVYLTTLNLSNFDTSKVTSMNSMFFICSRLQEIICPNGFDMSSCTNVANMFYGCTHYNGEPLHFKNVPRDLDFSNIRGTEGVHYVIDSYKD